MSSAGARGANERIIPLSRDERERSQGNLGYQSGWTLPARRTRRSLQQKRSDGQIIDKGLGCIFSAPLLGSKEKKRAAKIRLGVLSLRMPSSRGQSGVPGRGAGAEKKRISSRPPATCSHFRELTADKTSFFYPLICEEQEKGRWRGSPDAGPAQASLDRGAPQAW